MELIGYLLILVFLFTNLLEGIVVKRYAARHQSGGMMMNGVICFFACIFFLLTDTDGFSMPLELLPYGIASMLCYAAGFYSMFLAYKYGPFGLTALLAKLSLFFPVLYGIFVLKEETKWLTCVGFVVMIVSTILLTYDKKEKTPEKAFSIKWLIAVTVTVVSNGCISILTKIQQVRFDNAVSNEFLVLSLGGATVFLLGCGLITEREKVSTFLKSGIGYGAAAGLLNGAKNLTTIFIYLFLPLSIVSPVKSCLGTILTFLVATLFYKEKYTTTQKIGVLLGAIAVVAFAL